MRILIICSGNAPDFDFSIHQAFIYDQVQAIRQIDPCIEFDYFFIGKPGLAGYLACVPALKQQLKCFRYHCIHAHVAVSALLAVGQRRAPVVSTFHGSDINEPLLRILSLFVELRSHKTIYVSSLLKKKAIYTSSKKSVVIPCGVDLELFIPRPKLQSRQQLGLLPNRTYILFSSSFSNAVKNYPLARSAINLLADESIELLELTMYSRQQVALLFSAVDVALMTSFSEGSPQFVKEALACNCPVVSTDVGDVGAVLTGLDGCYLTSYDAADVAVNLRKALAYPGPLSLRGHIAHLDNRLIAKQVHDVYCQL